MLTFRYSNGILGCFQTLCAEGVELAKKPVLKRKIKIKRAPVTPFVEASEGATLGANLGSNLAENLTETAKSGEKEDRVGSSFSFSGSPIKEKLKESADKARRQIDQVLLGLNHSKLQKITQSVLESKGEFGGELITRIGENVLKRAHDIRQSLEEKAQKTIDIREQIEKVTKQSRQALRIATRKTGRRLKRAMRSKSAPRS